jgi:hypothetical protein
MEHTLTAEDIDRILHLYINSKGYKAESTKYTTAPTGKLMKVTFKNMKEKEFDRNHIIGGLRSI